MSDFLTKNAAQFFQKKFLGSTALHRTGICNLPHTSYSFNLGFVIIYDHPSATKHQVLVIDNLDNYRTNTIINSIGEIQKIFHDISKEIIIDSIPPETSLTSSVRSSQMLLNPKLYIYTNQLHNDKSSILIQLKNLPITYEIVDQSTLYKSLFLSYGGPDEHIATIINNELQSRGVKTWFFPDSSIPGKKLHKTMYDGVNEYDKILLLCSQNSLTRPGLLNELEEVFTREAKSGGQAILIPIALDNSLFSENHENLIKLRESRVIRTIDVNNKEAFEKGIYKILDALKIESTENANLR